MANEAVIVGCMLEAAVGVSAAASMVVAVAPDNVHDLDTVHWTSTHAVRGGVSSNGTDYP